MKITQKSYNTMRVISAEMIADSQVGDARSTTFCAPMMFTLFKEHYNFFGGKDYINRDRFVLADVGLTPLYYAMLNVFGINYTIEDLKNFGTPNSSAPIMPNLETDGIDASVNSKGQGIPTAVGLALASQSLASKFNAQKFSIISHYTYCFASTANLQEGVSQEAMSLAGSHKLSKLILICNYIEQQASGENIKQKYKAMGWNVITVRSASNYLVLSLALKRAHLSQKPTLILLVNNMAKKFPEITNRIITKNEVEKMKADFGFNGSYKIDNNVRQFASRTTRKLRVEYNKWEKKVVLYRNTHPRLSEELNNFFVKPKFPALKSLRGKLESITNLSSANKLILPEIRNVQKCLMVASIKEKFLPVQPIGAEAVPVFSKNNYRVQNLVFGNRENAMAEICAGISLYYGAPTYVYVPICLLGQMLSGIEHTAQNNLPVLFTFYQSGNCVSQQKINIELYGQFEWLKNLENLDIYQPATSLELLACYKNIFERSKPACLLLPEQEFEQIDSSFDEALKGVYVQNDIDQADYTYIASGREIYVAKAVKELAEKSGKKIKLISAPSLTVFFDQATKYQNAIMPSSAEKMVVFTCTSAKSNLITSRENCLFININDFTSTPESITTEIIKAIYKEIK